MMLQPFPASSPETAATTPGRSGQDRVSTNSALMLRSSTGDGVGFNGVGFKGRASRSESADRRRRGGGRPADRRDRLIGVTG
ncbi:hypothetical protein GCM10027612_71170 [Microbispora bryophytorum subsp. camponoti]